MGFVMPDLMRVVVAVDPAASSGEDADETGIIVAGKDKDSRGYVLADRREEMRRVERSDPAIITVIGGLAAPGRQRHWLSVAAGSIAHRPGVSR